MRNDFIGYVFGQVSDMLGRPGGDLLSHTLRCSTIGAKGFHVRVRDGIGWGTLARTTRSPKHTCIWHSVEAMPSVQHSVSHALVLISINVSHFCLEYICVD